MGERLKVDLDLCQGHGVCESEAPEVFVVGKNRKVMVLEENPDQSQMAAVGEAIKYCPTHALSMEEAE